MAPEIHKKSNIYANRLMMHDYITQMFGEELADEYLRQLEEHEIYRHDESGMPVGTPYCASITLYPFLFDGLTKLGGTTSAPHHLQSFLGGFINLVLRCQRNFAGLLLLQSSLPIWITSFARNTETNIISIQIKL